MFFDILLNMNRNTEHRLVNYVPNSEAVVDSSPTQLYSGHKHFKCLVGFDCSADPNILIVLLLLQRCQILKQQTVKNCNLQNVI